MWVTESTSVIVQAIALSVDGDFQVTQMYVRLGDSEVTITKESDA